MSRPEISREEVNSWVLQTLPGVEVQAKDFYFEPQSSQRQGIMGRHDFLAAKCYKQNSCDDNDCTELTLKFFLKTPPTTDPLADERVIQEEVRFFADLYPRLTENRGKFDEHWSPRCYVARPDLLVFEDLRQQGFAVRRDTVYDEESLKAVLTTLARFHAASLALEARSGEKLGKYVGEEKVFTNEGRAGRANKLAFETLRQLASERFNIKDADLIVPRIMKRVSELVKADDASTSGCNVICHGDLWRTNIMFDDKLRDQDKKLPLHCVLVDFQMLRYASAACDIVMLLFVHSASTELRDSMSEALQCHYHAILCKTLLRAGLAEESTTIPALESIKKEYEERKLLGMAYAALSWPSTVYKQVVGGGDPAKLEDWYFCDRITWYTKAMDEDEDYERRMRQRVTELLDEGRRLLFTIES